MKGREIALRALVFYEKSQNAERAFVQAIRGEKSQKSINQGLELFNGVIRWLYRLDYNLDAHLHRDRIDRIHNWTRNILRIGAFEKIILKKPDYAAVSESVKMSKKYGHRGTVGLVNAVLRNLSEVEYPDDELKRLSLYYSFPEWLVRRFKEIFGDETENFLNASNKTPPLTVRVNRLKTNPEEMIHFLKQSRMKADKGKHSQFSIYTEGRALKSRFFREGFFTVQDESSTLVLEGLTPEWDICADICSSPGGKSTHLAEMSGDKKFILASDVKGIERLEENRLRLGLHSIRPVFADGRNISLKNVDLILLDVPCSGLGVLSRRVDLKYRLSQGRISSLISLQEQLLENASVNVVSGGKILYVTCTLNPDENEKILKKFLAKHKNFDLIIYEGRFGEEGFFKTLPHRDGVDGIFGAILKRR